MNGLFMEQDQVAKRIKTCRTKALADLDTILKIIQQCLNRVEAKQKHIYMDVDGETIVVTRPDRLLATQLQMLQHRVTPLLSNLPVNHKEAYAGISKLGKTVDKIFETNTERISNPNAFQGKDDLLNKAIAQHLFRQGRFHIAELFMKEAAVEMPATQKDSLKKLHVIVEAIKQQDLSSALEWASTHSSQLIDLESDLEFVLHRLYFVHLIIDSQTDEALVYARTYFPKFAATKGKEIQQLMGSFVYVDRLDTSPYRELLAPTNWEHLADTFTTTCFQLIGLSKQCPFDAGISVGMRALPTLLKMDNVMHNNKDGVWTQREELPVEIELDMSHQYHSIFSCPVSREQTTDDNPPMRLPCGHVIAKDSLQKLSKGSRFKCPYCPSEQTASQARQIHF